MNNWYYQGHHGFVIFELETMKMMIDRVLAIVDDEVASADIRFRTQYEAVTDENGSSLDASRDELYISQTVIPRHVMNSLFTSLFAMFEDEMVTVCELVAKKAGRTQNFIDFSGVGVWKVQKYLKKYFRLNVKTFSTWQEIPDIIKLRNMMMHNNGRFETRDPAAAARLKIYIEANEWLSINETNHILIDRNYFTHVDQRLRAFLKELFPVLEARELI